MSRTIICMSAAEAVTGIEDGKDMGMLQPRRDLDLAGESLRSQGRRQIGAQDLDRNLATVPNILGEIHRRHAAGSELASEDVAPGELGLEAVEHLGHSRLGLGSPEYS